MKSSREILKFSLPAIAENFLQMLVGISDTFLVAHISLAAVAGVSLAANIITVYQALFIAIGAMSSSLVARAFSSNSEKLSNLTKSVVKLTVYVSLFLGIFSLFFSHFTLHLLGGRDEVLQLGTHYLQLVGGLIVLLGLMTSFGSFLRAKNDTKTPMIASVWVNILNILISWFLIFVLHDGVLGVAIGAVLARVFGTIYLYRKVRQAGFLVKFDRTKISRELIRLVVPASAERLVMRIGDLIVIAMIVAFGSHVFAGNSIGESLTQFNYMPAFGLATATVILTAQEFGQKNWSNLTNYVKKTYWLSTILVLSVSAVIYGSGNVLLSFFTQDDFARNAAMIVLLFALISTPFITGTTTYTAAFQGIGNAKLPFLTTTIGMLGIRVIFGFLFGTIFKLGLEGIWLAVLLDNFFRFIFLKIKFDRTIKTLN